MLNGVIIGKLRNLDEVTGELRSLGPLTTERLATDPNVLVYITNNHLQDFDRFRDEVLAYCAQ